MRFTKTQAALLQCGIPFVHLAPTQERCDKAKKDLLDEMNLNGWMCSHTPEGVVLIGIPDVCGRFMVCRLSGASSDHVAVMFVDGKKAEFKDQRAYDEARYIPAKIDGHGPMVVR